MDIGTGSGIIALISAQKNQEAFIKAIDIDNSSKKITIVIKSTIAPGTTEKFIIPLLNQSKKKIGKELFLAINPANILPKLPVGTATSNSTGCSGNRGNVSLASPPKIFIQ